jgi:hypothetical protein
MMTEEPTPDLVELTRSLAEQEIAERVAEKRG